MIVWFYTTSAVLGVISLIFILGIFAIIFPLAAPRNRADYLSLLLCTIGALCFLFLSYRCAFSASEIQRADALLRWHESLPHPNMEPSHALPLPLTRSGCDC